MTSTNPPNPLNADRTALTRLRSKHLRSHAVRLHEYAAFGLRIGCSMLLPDLEPVSLGLPSSTSLGSAPGLEPHKACVVAVAPHLDVVIQHADLPPIPKMLANRSGLAIRSTADTAHLIWPECGQFLVQSGCLIQYRPADGRTEAALHAPLLGVVLGVLLAQRGVFTLHASAVTMNGEAIGFLGEKGAGKSTTAAALMVRGHTLLTDDVLAISTTGTVTPTAFPAFPRMKLWPDAIAANGHQVAPLPYVTPESEKRILPADRFARSSAPLTQIYLLENGPEVRATRISEQAAFRDILPHVYAARFLGKDAGEAAHFKALQQIVMSVPVYRLERPQSLNRLDDLAAFFDVAQG